MSSERLTQELYYEQTASLYDEMHVDLSDEHGVALGWLSSLIEQHEAKSLLDIGSGTGRALLYLKGRHQMQLTGIEPVSGLREQGYAKGLARDELVNGDALALDFPDKSFDFVSAFGVLHHIKDHSRAVSEMCRVARLGVFISDANNFGQGGAASRAIKQAINGLGLWRAFDFIRTRGKGYHYSKGDGLFYSYSLFYDVPVIRSRFQNIQFITTRPTAGPNLYRQAEHLAVFGSSPK